MPDEQPTPIDSEQAEYATDETVLDLLILGDSQRPWTTRELALEIGSQAVVEDAIANLHAAGLVHRTSDGFVFAARPAIRYHDIIT
jgi:predicted transcriptional regulator